MPEHEVPNRRRFMQQFGAAMAAPALMQNPPAAVFVDNPKGGFRFLKSTVPYSSSGVLALPGYEVVHVTLASLPAYGQGFELIDRYLKEQKRPPQALCGVELRSPRQFASAGFQELSESYLGMIVRRGLLIDGANPIARVNVAPELDPPREVAIYGFSYTAPKRGARPTFLAASSESAGTYPQGIIARGDVSPAGLRQKAVYVLGRLDQRLRELGMEWNGVTTISMYTVHDMFPLMSELLLPRMGRAKDHGLRWYFARPPLQEIELEMSIRGCVTELVI